MTVDIPAHLVSAGTVAPQVCARHGEPATWHKRVRFRSYTPRWAYLLIFFGLLPFIIVAMFVRRRVTAPAWPFCERCRRLRISRLLIGLGMIALAVVVGFGLPALLPDSPASGWTLPVVVALVFAGVVTASYSVLSAIVPAHVSQDGTLVQVHRPHPRFAEQLRAQHSSSG
jgi:hypothetical protein